MQGRKKNQINQPIKTTQGCNAAIRLSVIIGIFICETNHKTTKFIRTDGGRTVHLLEVHLVRRRLC